MKFTIQSPNITQYQFSFDSSDPDVMYLRCMWAIINLDFDEYALTATSDCGNYSYVWMPTPKTESFKKLLSRMDPEYLLGKISNQIFDFNSSKESAVKQALDWSEAKSVVDAISSLEESSEEMFRQHVADITGWDYCEIEVDRKFPGGAVTFAKIFTDYLQPILKKELSVYDR